MFDKPGRHRVRLQPRHGPHRVEQIWLSPTQQTAPPPDARPPGIVLRAADARTAGNVKLADDELAADGRALRVEAAQVEVYPPHTDTGRTTTGTGEFTLKLEPDNWGVLLRRKLDYQFPNQRAEVSVQDEKGGWKPAGVWYTAGSSTCVYSNPPEELGATQHIVQTSNRRFRDDEFLIGRDLTRGRASIRVRVRFTPIDRPLFPGHPFPEKPAWSEVRYTAYSYVMPNEPK